MNDFYDYLIKEYNAPFEGWDFSYLSERMIEDPITWNYKSIVEKELLNKEVLLDMHTGGGEFLCSLSNLPPKTYATEGYGPNIPIAESRLLKKNITLKPIDGLKRMEIIPFADCFFDIIINRHGSYDIEELKRTLKQDGIFITQQVGGLNGIDINMALETKSMDYVEWCLVKNIDMFEKSGMEIIDFGENIGKMKFMDIGALVYYLKCIPWQVKNFTIEKYYNKLAIIKKIIDKEGCKNFVMHRFYIKTKKL